MRVEEDRLVIHPERMPVRRVATEGSGQAAAPMAPGARPGPLGTLAMAIWFGLAAGLVELGLTVALKGLHDPSPGFFRMNRNVVWIMPAFNLALFAGVGLPLALISWNWPRRGLRVASTVLGALALLTALLACHRLHEGACLVLACAIAYRLARRIEAQPAAFLGLVRWTLPFLGLAAFGLIVGPASRLVSGERRALAALPAPRAGAANVLLIVMDTVRADHLSLYGYDRDTTPNLKWLARRGIRFEQARSTAPWTLPSHASMMTGRWPHQLSARLHGPLDASAPTLAAFLASHGYATGGFVANTSYCGAETGLARGFAHYEDHDLTWPGILRATNLVRRVVWPNLVAASEAFDGDFRREPIKDAARISDDALAWAGSLDGKRPFFAFLNFIDAHSPYLPPVGFHRFFGMIPESAADFETLDSWFTADKDALSPRDHILARDTYDDCIAFIDQQIGRLLNGLRDRGRLDDTLIIVTADHGEHFGEHQLFGHASSLYDQELHVPLLIVPPGGTPDGPRTVAGAVSLRNLPATVADALGLGESSPFPGRSLIGDGKGDREGEPEPILSEVDGPAKSTPNLGRSPAFRGPMKALRIGEEVYIRNGDGVEEFYDTSSNPAQTRDLIECPSALARLDTFRSTLDRMTRDDGRPLAWRNTAGPRRQHGRTIEPPRRTR